MHCSGSLNYIIVCIGISFHRQRARGSHGHCQSSAAISHMHLKCCVFDSAKIRNLPVLYRYCNKLTGVIQTLESPGILLFRIPDPGKSWKKA